jgi:hypothetical protein
MATNQLHSGKTETDAYLRGTLVQGEIKERWMQLCEMAATEKDSGKLLGIVKEINRLLAEKEQRLSKLRQSSQTTAESHD